MAAMSTYLKNKLLDHVFNGVVYTPPTNIYLCLYKVNPGADDNGTEVVGGSYARLNVGFDAADGFVLNSDVETFAALPDTDVEAMALRDASTLGNLLTYVALSPIRSYSAGDTPSLDAGSLSVYFD